MTFIRQIIRNYSKSTNKNNGNKNKTILLDAIVSAVVLISTGGYLMFNSFNRDDVKSKTIKD